MQATIFPKAEGNRLFTQAELDECCRPAADRLFTLLDADPEQAKRLYDAWEEWQRRTQTGVFNKWAASFLEWTGRTHGEDALLRLQAEEQFFAVPLRMGATLEQLAVAQDVLSSGRECQRRLHTLIESGDAAAASGAYLEIEASLRTTFRLFRDRVTLFGTFIYREYGIAGLEQAMRYVWEHGGWWEASLREELARDPKERTRYWIDFDVQGFYTKVAAIEYDDRIVLNRECGSCGEQHRSGRYEAPWSFALIAEQVPTTWFKADMPVYRSHIAMVHGILPIEKHGVPWPAVTCSERKGGPCHYTIFKDPCQTSREFYESVGKPPPQR